jgi:hypothetical protein
MRNIFVFLKVQRYCKSLCVSHIFLHIFGILRLASNTTILEARTGDYPNPRSDDDDDFWNLNKRKKGK